MSLLTVVFGLTIHEAVGTGLAAMVFVTMSGTVSHYREGNTSIRAGITVGIAGVVGAIIGANTGQLIPEDTLRILSGLALWFLAFLVWLRARMVTRIVAAHDPSQPVHTTRQMTKLGILGLAGGIASAIFGVGMTPFIQLGMLSILKFPLVRAVGSTMLALIFISASGSLALAGHGDVSLVHLTGVTIGTVAGTYAGAKFTRRAPVQLLRAAIALLPFIAGSLLIFTG